MGTPVEILDIYILFIIHHIRNLNIYKLFIKFEVFNKYLLSIIIY
jgi:hypothetical protein